MGYSVNHFKNCYEEENSKALKEIYELFENHQKPKILKLITEVNYRSFYLQSLENRKMVIGNK